LITASKNTVQLKFDWQVMLKTLRREDKLLTNQNEADALKSFTAPKEEKAA
jgi:hypothetical protein